MKSKNGFISSGFLLISSLYNQVKYLYCSSVILYDVNMSMHYTVIFTALKRTIFHMKNWDIFVTFAQELDCGYMLEPPHLCNE